LWGVGDSTITTIPKRYKRTVEIQQKSHDGTHEIERDRERERERGRERERERRDEKRREYEELQRKVQ
jgi:hypothetical protein